MLYFNKFKTAGDFKALAPAHMKGDMFMDNEQNFNAYVSPDATYENLSLKDDFMFGKVMQQKETHYQKMNFQNVQDIIRGL